MEFKRAMPMQGGGQMKSRKADPMEQAHLAYRSCYSFIIIFGCRY